MSLADWLRAFRALHEKAKKGELSGTQAEEYRAGCDELSRALIAAQRLTLRPGEVPRRALRVALALQVTLETKVSSVRGMTNDVSVAGFSVLLGKAPAPQEELTATLRIPGAEPLVAAVVPGDVKPQPGSVRAAFLFQRLPDPARQRLEVLVIDTALSQLAG
jgi:hypothetical protein